MFLTVSLNIETLFVHAVIPSRSYMTGKYTQVNKSSIVSNTAPW